MQATPDGSALLVVETSNDKSLRLRVFHEASFGANQEGIVNSLPSPFKGATCFTVVSFGQRGSTFLVAVNSSTRQIVSVSVRVSHSRTQYQFQASRYDNELSSTARATLHNSLLDCWSKVWERYPIVPAIQRSVGFMPKLRLEARTSLNSHFDVETPSLAGISTLARLWSHPTTP